MKRTTLTTLALACGLALVQSSAAHAQTADAIYHGGDIVTINDAQPTADAVAVKGGKILAVGAKKEDDRRNIVIHSQFTRPDQLDSYVKFGITPSFFTAHAFFWGDVHIENLGEERAAFLSPMKSAKAKGIRFSNHTDFSVTPLDPMMPLRSAVTRQSRSGKVIGPDQRVTPLDALRALTLDAAWQYHEEKAKGSIETGKLADLVILDQNPLKVAPDALRNIKVLETIKEGKSVYQRAKEDAGMPRVK